MHWSSLTVRVVKKHQARISPGGRWFWDAWDVADWTDGSHDWRPTKRGAGITGTCFVLGSKCAEGKRCTGKTQKKHIVRLQISCLTPTAFFKEIFGNPIIHLSPSVNALESDLSSNRRSNIKHQSKIHIRWTWQCHSFYLSHNKKDDLFLPHSVGAKPEYRSIMITITVWYLPVRNPYSTVSGLNFSFLANGELSSVLGGITAGTKLYLSTCWANAISETRKLTWNRFLSLSWR